jgi:hypothetical protein
VRAVGERVGSIDALNWLPVGSVICNDDDVDVPFNDLHNAWRKVASEASDIWEYVYDGHSDGTLISPDDRANMTNLSHWTIHTVGVNPNYVIHEDAELSW